MFKVLIWDYTGESSQWLDRVADKKDIEIVGTITPEESVPEILLNREAWDCLLIFEKNMREFFDVTLLALKLPTEKIIYALDIQSWLQHPKALYNILNNSGGALFIDGMTSSISVSRPISLHAQLKGFLTLRRQRMNSV